MQVAACQAALNIEAPREAWQAALTMARDAADRGAELIVLSELAITGYVFHELDEARRAAATAPAALVELADLSAQTGAVIVAGYAEPDSDRVYNSAARACGGHVLGTYRKAHLWDREKLYFTPGSQTPLVVETPAGRIAVMICYDLEFPE